MNGNDLTNPAKNTRQATRGVLMVLMAVLLLLGGLLLPIALAGEESADTIDARISQRQVQLDQLKAEAAALDEVIATRDTALEASRHRMADANASLRRAEDRYNEVLSIYEDRLVALYKNGDHEFFNIILDSEGFNDAVTRVSYVSKISENDIRLIARVKAEENALRLAREEVDAVKQMAVESLDSLQEKKALLAADINELQALQDKEMVELVKARAVEQEAAARRLAEEAARIDLSGMVTGPMVVQNQPPAGLQPTGTVLHGVSSWYGPGFQGNRTANGEIYDMYAFTAAHKTLPFNTWLKVSYNGRSVFVRINDRGPYIGGRFLDLSKAGAQALGFSGVAYVTAEIYR